MNCPIDNTPLAITERQGAEIDYCPQCRGVWLDRGELDKIIEKSAAVNATPQQYREPEHRQPAYRDDYEKNRHQSQTGHHPKKKRESFLGDLFDF